ncbi:DUF2909 domain-containing protein [Aliiglaciecola sp. CAU 1673]|uniref:DUF2909 domain-containing protein n=1 Tax=Aliiglaciecola sp. CAU 1673 TaxID=3032595 RepID=UPI0023DB2191|nr:DUF2909 domain-containing protein [Aliiglaciecola sp. CAU 1673]MDF2179255.1 DUF2909 domain-containing protein [Aliiglaciecola sp. CAU 1673]
MIFKIIIVALLFFMIFNLFRAMVIMIQNKPGQPSMTRYIGRRVFTSALIILLLLVAMALGWITPNPRPY